MDWLEGQDKRQAIYWDSYTVQASQYFVIKYQMVDRLESKALEANSLVLLVNWLNHRYGRQQQCGASHKQQKFTLA
ncbi:hypothetical protein [Lactobacillus crispatus]|uniref:hypothetical protein n=1 Tax=Lactobacillus crispatus TaxID=47770 RepID=UPI00336AB018